MKGEDLSSGYQATFKMAIPVRKSLPSMGVATGREANTEEILEEASLREFRLSRRETNRWDTTSSSRNCSGVS
jgi:hypothetical protein